MLELNVAYLPDCKPYNLKFPVVGVFLAWSDIIIKSSPAVTELVVVWCCTLPIIGITCATIVVTSAFSLCDALVVPLCPRVTVTWVAKSVPLPAEPTAEINISSLSIFIIMPTARWGFVNLSLEPSFTAILNWVVSAASSIAACRKPVVNRPPENVILAAFTRITNCVSVTILSILNMFVLNKPPTPPSCAYKFAVLMPAKSGIGAALPAVVRPAPLLTLCSRSVPECIALCISTKS